MNQQKSVFIRMISYEKVNYLLHFLDPRKEVRVFVSKNDGNIFKIRLLYFDLTLANVLQNAPSHDCIIIIKLIIYDFIFCFLILVCHGTGLLWLVYDLEFVRLPMR